MSVNMLPSHSKNSLLPNSAKFCNFSEILSLKEPSIPAPLACLMMKNKAITKKFLKVVLVLIDT